MAAKRTKLTIVAAACTALVAGSVPTSAQNIALEARRPQVCEDPTDSLTLFAKKIGKRRIGYGLTPKSASIPGPTIEMVEGECLQVTLVNDTNKRLSTHYHGVSYTVASDGTPLNRGCVAPGRTRSYVIQATRPGTRADGSVDPGSAGYWHYHDHCHGSAHGTAGISKGLFGALIVRRAGDPVPDRKPYVVVMSQTHINLKKAPWTPTFRANLGERVEFVVIGHGELMHTFHLHGHRWVDNRTGFTSTVGDPTRIIDNRTVGPADSFGFQVIAGEHVGPGAWMYHCHVQSHSDAGMAGLFMVRTPEGQSTRAGTEALQEFRSSQTGGHH
ncbi:MAG TPA: multicopper oxidase domain-containing protein [Actinomycetota bacterium]|nr:multicopper oxidase domain-containing protein [Actinomycetota bacterium]